LSIRLRGVSRRAKLTPDQWRESMNAAAVTMASNRRSDNSRPDISRNAFHSGGGTWRDISRDAVVKSTSIISHYFSLGV
jgi:hypothetical protein